MKLIILEGHNDLIFISTIIHQILERKNFPKYDHRNGRGFQEILRNILHPGKYSYLKENFGFLVYGDNGKNTVISKILPRCAYDIMGKIPERIQMLTILDEDGVSFSHTINQICENIRLKNIPHTRILCDEHVRAFSERDSRYSIEINLYLIPQSLEKNLVRTALQSLKISESKKRELTEKDPHRALREIADMLGISLDTLIRKSVDENWFSDSTWFNELLTCLRDFLNDFPER